jgi:hypothetical protein
VTGLSSFRIGHGGADALLRRRTCHAPARRSATTRNLLTRAAQHCRHAAPARNEERTSHGRECKARCEHAERGLQRRDSRTHTHLAERRTQCAPDSEPCTHAARQVDLLCAGEPSARVRAPHARAKPSSCGRGPRGASLAGRHERLRSSGEPPWNLPSAWARSSVQAIRPHPPRESPQRHRRPAPWTAGPCTAAGGAAPRRCRRLTSASSRCTWPSAGTGREGWPTALPHATRAVGRQSWHGAAYCDALKDRMQPDLSKSACSWAQSPGLWDRSVPASAAPRASTRRRHSRSSPHSTSSKTTEIGTCEPAVRAFAASCSARWYSSIRENGQSMSTDRPLCSCVPATRNIAL